MKPQIENALRGVTQGTGTPVFRSRLQLPFELQLQPHLSLHLGRRSRRSTPWYSPDGKQRATT